MLEIAYYFEIDNKNYASGLKYATEMEEISIKINGE